MGIYENNVHMSASPNFLHAGHSCFCSRLLTFFQNELFPKNSFRSTIRVSNNQDGQNVQTVCKGYQLTTKVCRQQGQS